MSIANSTLHDNSALAGGGIVNYLGTLTVSNSTLFGNSASFESGGIGNAPGSTMHLKNTIIAGSPSGGDCINDGILATNINNLIEDGTCSPLISGDPLLDPLVDNGGPTETMIPLAGSPAIDAGDDATCEATDQRGVARPQGVHCDVGALETWQPIVNVDHDLGDGICDPVECTLREAVAVVESAGTITFDPSLAGENIKIDSEIALNKNLTIDGSSLSSHVQVDGGNSVRVFSVGVGIGVTIDHLGIVDGYASGGGGISNQGVLTVSNTLFSANDGQENGGGISNSASGALTITNCTFSSNSAISGGAIANSGLLTIFDTSFSSNNGLVNGGAIANDSAVMLTARRSTFSGNTTGVYGGGIYNDGSPLTVINSTFSGNSSSGSGGGLYNDSGTLNVSGSTFFDNSASVNGGGVYNASGALLLLKNSILASSPSGGDCSNDGILPVNVNNLIEDGTCSPDLTGDPLLGLLTDNGGFTQTMALGAGSPAIDAGDDASCEVVDQRGVTRPQGAHCDVGAFEVEVVYPYTLYLPLIMR
jgi:predicted outer membrane repeat protein